MKAQWQHQMDAAFDNYFAMSKVLQADMEFLLEGDLIAHSARRNFIRAASSLVEGYTHCFREMCQVGIATGAGPLSADEVKVLTAERGFSSIDRTKLTTGCSGR